MSTATTTSAAAALDLIRQAAQRLADATVPAPASRWPAPLAASAFAADAYLPARSSFPPLAAPPPPPPPPPRPPGVASVPNAPGLSSPAGVNAEFEQLRLLIVQMLATLAALEARGRTA